MAVSKLLRDSVEDNVLTLLCWHNEAAPQIALQVSPEIFSTREYQRIAQFAIDHLARYGVPPRGAHLKDYMERELRQREGAFLRQVVDAMEELYPELQPAPILRDLDQFIATRRLAIAMEKAFDRLDQGDLAGARDALYETTIVARPQAGVFLQDTDKWLSFLRREENEGLSSGIDILDERGVRPARKELYLHIGPRKSGKTWALIQIGKRAIYNRHDVLHLTLENSSEVTRQRYTQAILGLTLEQTRELRVPIFSTGPSGRFTLEWDRIKPEQLSTFAPILADQLRPYQSRGRLYVQELPSGTCTLANLNALLDSLERTEKFTPSVVIVDYINLMQIEDVRQHRLSLGKLGVGLRGLAVQRNVAVVTATQSNRSSANAKLVTGSHVAEDWSLLGTADTVVTYSQTNAERQLNIARIYVDASRNAPDKWVAQISQSYATGQFCLDSIYMDKDVQDEMARHFDDTHEEPVARDEDDDNLNPG